MSLSNLSMGMSGPTKGVGVVLTPLGVAMDWAARVTANGGTYSTDTYDAVLDYLIDLDLAGVLNKILYLNARCGSDIIAARTALIAVEGTGLDTATGTFAAWNELNGLVNSASGIMDFGVKADNARTTANNIYIGVYSLADQAGLNAYAIGNTGSASGLLLRATSEYMIFDYAGRRSQTDVGNLPNGSKTKGQLAGSQTTASVGGVFRNAAQIGNNNAVNAGAQRPNLNWRLVAANVTSGGEIISSGLTPTECVNVSWAAHTFNVRLGRGVTAEGLF
ncbi:hypothetical protein [Phenylobacterium sp.]|uniref:hypothetical protein n=1 Tax=Phenylobacterium sp. TaxID=1871053 RepID=UPI0027283795|nr:hypothetical protein [Phenylobacterium sp.]MDO8800039.1 hypothetical protein [Phenylobacterium sp.]